MKDTAMFDETKQYTDYYTIPSSSTAIKHKNSTLDTAINKAQEKLLSLQDKEGYWVFELEADCTIPAEYIMMMHYLDDIDEELQAKMANYLHPQSGWCC
jgi:squalene-hopene/tetraprenyl-beta-curcumene cyclase